MIDTKRIKDLHDLEMAFNGDEFIGKNEINKDFNVHAIEIKTYDDDAWDKLIISLKTELKSRKK